MIEVSSDLLAFLKQEEARSRNEDLLDRAEVALDSYNGNLYGDEEDGRSQVVTRDVAEVVDQMEIAVLRVFVSGDRVVEFEPSSSEEEQAADDATEVVQRQFSRKGYQLLHDWFKEGNLCVAGIVKSCVERKRARVEFLTDDPERDEAIEADSLGIDPETGVEMFRAVKLEEREPEFKDYLVPLEEYRGDLSNYRDLDAMPYQAHASAKTLSDLVEMGFDRDEVESLSSDLRRVDQLSDARGEPEFHPERQGALRRVLLLEEYVCFDADGDGIAERLCIHRVGDTILRIEPTDYHPFTLYCPFPMPGRATGHALAEKVTDIQRVNTVLNRLALDGLYCNLAPGYIVPDTAVNANTYDDLLTVRPNRIVRTTGKADIVPEAKNEVSAVAWQAMEFMIGQRESRTGITRLNQGLDADALNKTATGTALMQAQGQQMEEYLARNFAEALASLMRLKRKLLSRYGSPVSLRVDGQYREIDPRQWGEDMDVIIRVGLGSGRKEQRLAYRMQMLGVQQQVMMSQLPIVTPEHIYKSIAGLVRDANLGSPADYVLDPETLKDPQTGEMPPQPPSADEQKAQAEMQMQAAKMQGDQQLQAQKLDGMRQEAMLKADLARQVAETDAQLARDKAEFEAQQARDKFEFEKQLAVEKLRFEERRSQADAARRDKETDAKVSANRPGGKLDE